MNDLINNFINSNSKHHQILYNNKIVIIDYVDKKREFKIGCMRIIDNISINSKGFIKTSKSEYYMISHDSKSAKKITLEDLIKNFE